MGGVLEAFLEELIEWSIKGRLQWESEAQMVL